MELTQLDGIGPARAQALRAMGINSLRDLLFMLPVRYEDHTTVYPCNTNMEGDILVCGNVMYEPRLSFFHGLKKTTTTIEDKSGKMPVCWYNAPWIKDKIRVGEQIYLYGRLTCKNNKRLLQNPSIVTREETLVPVYRSMKGFPEKSLRKLIRSSLVLIDDCCPDTLPVDFRMKYHLCELNFAIRQAHFPVNEQALEIARRRLSFEKILFYLVYVNHANSWKTPGYSFQFSEKETDRYWNSLPFTPTSAQVRVLNEIASDLKKSKSMHRMLQGDVGCGKTAVAFGALYLAASSGYQSSMMAPTEILAFQHYENAKQVFNPFGIRCRLLTGSTKSRERREILQELKEHRCDIVFGTHALISKDVIYSKLGLVITDEQHRFGVKQRTDLQNKGKCEGISPHVLVMSATPIPRSLALVLYGDLDLSLINELPSGRIPVKTRLVPENKRSDMYKFLKKEIQSGKQAYIVCPLVENDDDHKELHSVKSHFEHLSRNELSGLKLGLIWGSQKTEEKSKILHEFSSGACDILVSTTVIEVGVNNPNATIMVIENAERFGLSQLHQLRGRVGRGQEESWCFLFADSSDRLRSFCSTNDGFIIAQKDLEIRGPGDLIGTRQSGILSIDNAFTDIRLLDEVTQCVRELHRDDTMKDALDIIEIASMEYFASKYHSIAMN